MTKSWSVRHSKTGVLVGWLKADIPSDFLDPKHSPVRYHIRAFERDAAPLPEMDLGSEMKTRRIQPVQVREATVLINTAQAIGLYTLWVEKASELYGMTGFNPFW